MMRGKGISRLIIGACFAISWACSSGGNPSASNGDGDNGDGDGSLGGAGSQGDDPVLVDPDGSDPSAPIDLGPTNVEQGFAGEISGPLDESNALWGPGDVTLTGAVTIPAGVSLELNPGTHVFGDYPIVAEGGSFVCNGSFADPATLFGSSLVLRGGKHSMRFCTMNSTAETAIDVDGAQVGIEHFQLQRFGKTGVAVHGAGAKVSINYSTLGSAGNLFTGDDLAQEGVAVRFAADAASSGSHISNSVLGFLHNATNIGLRVEAAETDLAVSYSMISGTGAMPPLADATGVYFGFPNVTDIPNLDYHLNFFSPALDLADPVADHSLEPAPNGGRANIGYFGRTPGARITSVELTHPNGCEEFEPGETVTVRWKSSKNTGPKTIEFSPDGGTTWEVLANIVDDDGQEAVILPDVTTTDALLRFSQDNDPVQIFDVSNRTFALGGPADEEACALEIRCPPGTEGCKPFEVICYTGYRDDQMPTGLPSTEPSYEEVLEDMNLMAPYTHGIRTYGSGLELHNGKYVPTIADNLGLDLHMGIWIDDSYTDGQNMAAIADALSIVEEGHPSIKTLIVGNEYMLRVRQNFGDTEAAEERLVGYIEYVREMAPEEIQVVTGESYPDWVEATAALFNAVDTVVWHVHPWWQQHAIDDAAQHVENAHNELLARMDELGVDKPELLGETGYPWAICNGVACGSEENQARYLAELHEYSLRSGLEYWFFSGFDESWKSAEGPVGDKWGMWSTTRMPHAVITGVDDLIEPEGLWAP